MPEQPTVSEWFAKALRQIPVNIEKKPPVYLLDRHAAELAEEYAHHMRPNEVRVAKRQIRTPPSLTDPLEVVITFQSDLDGLFEGTSPLAVAADGETGPAQDRYLKDAMNGPLIAFTCPQDHPERAEERAQRIAAVLRTRSDAIRAAFGPFVEALAREIAAIQAKVAKRDEKLAEVVARSQFTLIQRDGIARRDVTARIQQKKPLGVPSPDGEFTITDQEYAAILSKLRDAACFFEGTPAAFWSLSEPLLRDCVAFVLKANFFWTTGGELFRNVGKSDIAVLVNRNAVFIAELKKWRSATDYAGVAPGGQRSALEQVMDYTTWRDTKVALVCFCGRRNFERTVDRAIAQVRQHTSVRGEVQRVERNEFVSRHENPDRADHFVTVTHLFVDLGAAGGEEDE